MRILQIHLHNLNALSGRWQVDLTDSAYGHEGLFVITGPTGAGKSTLFDAICLALYGRTPRLDRIGKSGNDILSRQQGECFAEVVFETPAGRWRAHWSQRRAWRRPDGELQAPRHELADATDGRLLATSMREVAAQVEALTGMDFERFTRAMLLAQGGFAAFLLAEPDQRAPLLEQLTGTTLYSHISIRVHERHRQEQAALEQQQAALQHLAPLPEAERQAAHAQAQRLDAEIATLSQRMAQAENALRWGERIGQLHRQLADLAHQQQALAAQATAFAPEQARLDAARRALELAATHSALVAQRQRHTQALAEQAQLQARSAQQRLALQQAQAEHAAAEQQAQQAQTAWQQAQPSLQQARALDAQYQQHLRTEQEAAAQAQQADAQLAQAHAALGDVQRQHQQLAHALAQTQRTLRQHQGDAELVVQWPTLQARLGDVAQQQAAAEQRQRQLQQARHTLEQHAQAQHASAAALQQHQQHSDRAQRALAQQHTALAELLGQQPLAQWRHVLEQARQHTLHWQEAQAQHQRWQTAAAALAHAQQQHQQWRNAQEASARSREQLHTRIQAQTQALAQLERQWQLELHIQKLEDLRGALIPGQPCPLCGAHQHPYASERPAIAPHATRSAMDEARSQLNALREQHTQAEVQHARQGQQVRQSEADIARENAACHSAHNALRTLLDTLLPAASATAPTVGAVGEEARPQAAKPTATPQAEPTAFASSTVPVAALDASTRWADWLAQRHTAQAQHSRQLARHIQQVEAEEAQLHHLRQQADAARDACEQARQQLAIHTQQHSRSQARLQALQEAAQAPDTQLAQRIAQLQDPLQNQLPDQLQTPLQTLTPEAWEQLQTQLRQRCEQWQRWQAQANAQQQQQDELAQRLALSQHDVAHLGAQAEQRRQHHQQLREQGRALRDARQGLLQGRPADAVETALRTQAEQAQQARQTAHTRSLAAENALQASCNRLDALARSLAQESPQRQAAEADFTQQLQARGFADETAWQAATLPEAERQRLHQHAQALQRRQDEWAGQQREATRALAAAEQGPNPLHAELALAAEEVANMQANEAEPTTAPETDPPETDPQLASAQGEAPSAVPWQAELHALRHHQRRRQASRDRLSQTLGALQQRLHDDAQLRQRHTRQLQAIAAQQRECERWALLHQLIGSADGKKYRNFVQGLGFGTVIAHANLQLQRMSERYLLVRDTAQPLALNVMDHDQGGAIRTVKNLSGGESFIVSLALALGLSHMASRSVRVDSLFLDEGFGALDEHTLDIALDALANLRSEGKLIGIISHIQALKDRIPTQIEVVPLSGGRSALRGPGVRQLSAS